MTYRLFFGLLGLAVSPLLPACRSSQVVLNTDFASSTTPPSPDYALASSWAALPTTRDLADSLPSPTLQDQQSTAPADVFFIHPTSFTYQPTGPNQWNGDVGDKELNRKTDEGAILNQASLFNGAGRVYAPRYRQAHLKAYFADEETAKQAFELAYQDVKAAFNYYLTHYHQGRPIVVAGHSQGTQHARRLLAELFDGQPLQQQLVVAYLVGMPIPANAFQQLKWCESPTETGCFCTWNTFATGHYPPNHQSYLSRAAVTNPLTWATDSLLADRKLNRGSVGQKFKYYPSGFVDAQAHRGMLWINKPYITGRALINLKNWHVADYNLFYVNVRENAIERVNQFRQRTK